MSNDFCLNVNGQHDSAFIPDSDFKFPMGDFTIDIDFRVNNIEDIVKINSIFNKTVKKTKNSK